MGNNLHVSDVQERVFDCQRKTAVIYELVRAIEHRCFENERYPNLEFDCLIEAGESLKAVYDMLRELSNRSPWETCEAVEGGDR